MSNNNNKKNQSPIPYSYFKENETEEQNNILQIMNGRPWKEIKIITYYFKTSLEILRK